MSKEELRLVAREVIRQVGIPKTEEDVRALVNAFEHGLRQKGFTKEADNLRKRVDGT